MELTWGHFGWVTGPQPPVELWVVHLARGVRGGQGGTSKPAEALGGRVTSPSPGCGAWIHTRAVHCCPSGPRSWGVHSMTLESAPEPPWLGISRGHPAANTTGSLFPAQKPNMRSGMDTGGGWWGQVGLSGSAWGSPFHASAFRPRPTVHEDNPTSSPRERDCPSPIYR